MTRPFFISFILGILFTLPGNAQSFEQCLSDEKREEIKAELIRNSQRLQREGLLIFHQRNIVQLEWPLKQADGYNDPGYYAITNYVDQDNTSGILDYNCGSQTYDGHKGIDIMLWPYRWDKQDNDEVEIIAAAAGTIIGKDDGHFDKNCDCTTFNWNAVYIQHADGSVAWYGHMKKNSLTLKNIGETVDVGEYLGIVGSSGCSTDPHLHLELYANPSQTILVEPFAGDCNNLNGNTSWWADQKPYKESSINKLMTHYNAPEQNFGCPADNDLIYDSDTFDPGDQVYFSANYQNQAIFHQTSFKIYRPDHSIWQSWNHFSPNTYSASWWYWSLSLPTNEQEGLWTFEAVYQGTTYTHSFQVGDLINTGLPHEIQSIEVFPNPFSEHLTIDFENMGEKNIELVIYTADNKRMLSIDHRPGEVLTISTENFAKGVYLLKLTARDQTIVKKLVKM